MVTKENEKREKEKRINLTPEEFAKEFWMDFHRNIQEQLTLYILDNRAISPDEKKHHLSFINKKRSLPDHEPVGGLKDLALDHHFLVKPDLPWDKIKSILQMVNIDDLNIENLLFILKPSPIEQQLIPNENPLQWDMMAVEKTICGANYEIL